MFEKNVDIPDKDNKIARLQLQLLKNMIFRDNSKVNIESLEIWNGIGCSLNCKYCFREIPFVKGRPYDLSMLKEDLSRLFQMADIKHVIIGGGDAFRFHGIDELITFLISEIRVHTILVRTNGRTVPSDEELKLMNRFKDKVSVMLQKIGNSEEMSEYFRESQAALDKAEVKYVCIDQGGKGKWINCGDPRKRHHYQTARRAYLDCNMKKCPTLFEGKLYGCPRGVNYAEVTGGVLSQYEMLDVRKNTDIKKTRSLLKIILESDEYREYCRYCIGKSERNPLKCSSDEKWIK